MPNKKARNYELNLNRLAELPKEKLTQLAQAKDALFQQLSATSEFWHSESQSFGLPLDVLVTGEGADLFLKLAKEILGHDLYAAGQVYIKYNGSK